MTPNTLKALVRKAKAGQGWCEKHLEGFDDSAYRQILRDYGGAKAEPPSTLEQGLDLENVIQRLHDLGFPRTRPARAGRDRTGEAVSKQALLRKVDAYLAEGRFSTAYADGISQRMFKVEKLEWLYPWQLRAVVTALQKAAEKAGRATA